MQKLVQGIHQFQEAVFSSKQELFERLAGGQQPLALFIKTTGRPAVAYAC
jgi:carbonic anhydrase